MAASGMAGQSQVSSGLVQQPGLANNPTVYSYNSQAALQQQQQQQFAAQQQLTLQNQVCHQYGVLGMLKMVANLVTCLRCPEIIMKWQSRWICSDENERSEQMGYCLPCICQTISVGTFFDKWECTKASLF